MSADEEQFCQFVSSRGILKSCDVHPLRPQSSVRAFPHADYPSGWIEKLERGHSVYVCTSAMRDFVANVFPRLPASCPAFVLVTGDADHLAPMDIFPSAAAAAEFLNSPRILTWFAQNCVASHAKLRPLPIGLDYHTIMAGKLPWWGPQRTAAEQEADLKSLRETACIATPPYRAYSNFHFNMYGRFGRDRQAAVAQISRSCVYYEPHKTTRLESWQRQKLHHRFVLSPPGMGLDCHRTWEALCLGCMPIVRSSPLNILWEGLPVWVVNSWSEVTKEAMARKAAELDNNDRTGAIPEKLLLKTWVDKIRQAGLTNV